MIRAQRHLKQSAGALAFAVSVLAVAGAVSPASAHHSFAMFDRDKKVTLKGVVTKFEWTNPHVFLELVIQDDKNRSENWSVEGASPNMLFRQGWTFESFRPGDQVTVIINPLRDGGRGGTFVSAILPSGKTLGESAARAPG
jgi:hypothetical protein